jgi:EAL domain-containing protein (putative c-di-GMP-specific phosphodiesterase class I)
VHPEDLMDPALYLPTAPLTRLAKQVVLELTDRASLEHVTDAADRIARLRALGYRIALDDLGAGLAGLETFSQLEPEFVKVDTSVIRGIHEDAAKSGIVRSIVRVCHNMGKAVIAEGVETNEERSALDAAGCDFMQGYLFGRPGPLADNGDLELAEQGVA